MSAAATATAPGGSAATAPPIRRDRMTQSWVLAASVSALGDAALSIAVVWTCVRLFSPTTAGLVVAVETVPQAAFTLLGGVLADRFDTRRIMLTGEVLRALTAGVFGALWWGGYRSLPVLLALALLFGTIAGISDPARSTLVRQLVGDADLAVVAGWQQIGSRLAILAGSPVGAVVVSVTGLASAMALDALTFVATAAVLWRVVRPRRSLRATRTSWRAALPALRRYLAADPRARTLLIGICALNVFVAPVTGVGVALRVHSSRWPSTWLGAADATFAVCAIVGSVLAMRHRRGRAAVRGFAALVAQGAALAVVGVDSQAVLLLAMAAVGVTAGLASVWIGSTFQRMVRGDQLGRVSSLSQLGDQLLVPAMTPAFGVLTGVAGLLPATASCGIAMAVMSALVGSRREIRLPV